MDTRPTRKRNRLMNYDYSENGAYFVTICTRNRANYFWTTEDAWTPPVTDAAVGAITDRPRLPLSDYGCIVEQSVLEIPKHYPGIEVANYVIMPNHVHLLLIFRQRDPGRSVIAPTTLSTVVRHLKGFATRAIGFNLWQRSFHDHVIRNQTDFNQMFQYIDQNPKTWQQDCFFVER